MTTDQHIIHHVPVDLKGPLAPWAVFMPYEIMAVPRWRGVNLGSWLFTEQWMVPDLYSGLPSLNDGTAIRLQSRLTKKFLSTPSGGGTASPLTCKDSTPSNNSWFRILRMGSSSGPVKLRTDSGGYFVTAVRGGGSSLVATRFLSGGKYETFTIRRHPKFPFVVMLQASNGFFLSTNGKDKLKFDVNPKYVSLKATSRDWSGATAFNAIVMDEFLTEWQLAAGLGPAEAKKRLTQHWSTFITEADFKFLQQQVRGGELPGKLPSSYCLQH
eukprot:jgi/Mesen1/7916/ME000422S07075